MEHRSSAAWETDALTEKVYEIDLKGQWADPKNEEARSLAYKQLAAAAETLRNLIVTAWARSGEPTRVDSGDNPISPNHPKYYPATGSRLRRYALDKSRSRNSGGRGLSLISPHLRHINAVEPVRLGRKSVARPHAEVHLN
jgi:hypothetical protein